MCFPQSPHGWRSCCACSTSLDLRGSEQLHGCTDCGHSWAHGQVDAYPINQMKLDLRGSEQLHGCVPAHIFLSLVCPCQSNHFPWLSVSAICSYFSTLQILRIRQFARRWEVAAWKLRGAMLWPFWSSNLCLFSTEFVLTICNFPSFINYILHLAQVGFRVLSSWAGEFLTSCTGG
jgi:hypothetical protein